MLYTLYTRYTPTPNRFANTVTTNFANAFRRLEEQGELDRHCSIDIFCLHVVFLPLIQARLDEGRHTHNWHAIRPQRQMAARHARHGLEFVWGKPGVLFTEEYGGATVGADSMIEHATHIVTRLPVRGTVTQQNQSNERMPHEAGPSGVPEEALQPMLDAVYESMDQLPHHRWDEIYSKLRRGVYAIDQEFNAGAGGAGGEGGAGGAGGAGGEVGAGGAGGVDRTGL